MDQFLAIVLAFAAVWPLLTSLIMQPHWSDRWRAIVGVISSIVGAILAYIVDDAADGNLDLWPLDAAKLITAILLVIPVAAATYARVWRKVLPDGQQAGRTALEEKTTVQALDSISTMRR